MDYDLIKRHYLFLNHKKQTEIRLFDKSDLKSRVFVVENVEEFINEVKKHEDNDVGVGVHERANGGIEDSNVTNMQYFVVDIDTKEDNIIKDCETRFKENGFEYAAKIFTGQKGYHYYFKIHPIEGNLTIKEVLYNCKIYFIEDLKLPIDSKCFNPSRVFRVWGTKNKGNLVQLIDFNEHAKLIDLEKDIPKAKIENVVLVNKEQHQVLDNFELFDDLYKDPSIFPIRSNTNFNDVIVKNLAAYIQKKKITNIKPYYELIKRKKHPLAILDNWLKKPRTFNPFEVIFNINKFYSDTPLKKYTDKLRQSFMHTITYIEDEEMKWKDIKQQYRDTNNFVVNKQYDIEGEIINIKNDRIIFKLAKVYRRIGTINEYTKLYFDDPEFSRGFSNNDMADRGIEYIGEINCAFYHYIVLDIKTNIEIQLFSEERLDNDLYRLYGTLIKRNDQEKLSDYAKISTYTYIMILHSYKNKENKIIYNTYEELLEDFKDVTGDDFYRYLMTESKDIGKPCYYNTTEFYKSIYTSFIFSGKSIKFQPMNLLIFGPTGTGKTAQMSAIREKFDEECYSGTSLTMLGLTLSFATNVPKYGALLKAKNVCFIDELLKIFSRSGYDIGVLNDYLDNAKVSASSGNCDVNVRSTCQTFAVTNPVRVNKGNNNKVVRSKLELVEMFNEIDSDFWGRFLIINQNQGDFEWIVENHVETNVIIPNIGQDKFMGLYDFFKSHYDIIGSIDRQRYNKILKDIENDIPEDIIDIYRKNCNRTSDLFFDGLVKWRCFSTKSELKIIDIDYDRFESLWRGIIRRWYYGQTKSPMLTLQFSNTELDLINELKKEGEVHYRAFSKKCEDKGVDYKEFKSELEKRGLIEKFDWNTKRIKYRNDAELLEELQNEAYSQKTLEDV